MRLSFLWALRDLHIWLYHPLNGDFRKTKSLTTGEALVGAKGLEPLTPSV
jgi:hypothetical protein